MRLKFATGSGTATIGPDAVILESGDPSLPDALYEMVLRAGLTLDVLVDELAKFGIRSLPSFACAIRTLNATHVLVRGDVTVVTGSDHRRTRIDARSATTWTEHVDASDTHVEMRVHGEHESALRFTCTSGVVPASMVVWGADESETAESFASSHPASTPEQQSNIAQTPARGAPIDPFETDLIDADRTRIPTTGDDDRAADLEEHPTVFVPEYDAQSNDPVPQPSPLEAGESGLIASVPIVLIPASEHAPAAFGDHDGDTVLFAPTPATRGKAPSGAGTAGFAADGPTVQAVHCPDRHPNPVHVSACRICQRPITDRSQTVIPRPALGWLILDSGHAYPLDRDMLLGRAPVAPRSADVAPRLVTIAQHDEFVSRTHLRIALEDWQVFVTDLGSTNSTMIYMPGRSPQQLRPDEPTMIVPGTRIDVGGEQMTFGLEQP